MEERRGRTAKNRSEDVGMKIEEPEEGGGRKTEVRKGERTEEGGIREEDGSRRIEDSRQDLRTEFRGGGGGVIGGRMED
jgi:hypothetical protein